MDTCQTAEICAKVKRRHSSLDNHEVLKTIDSFQGQFNFDGLLYDAALETNPDLLDDIPIENVIGNTSQTLRNCKNPSEFFTILEKFSIPFPDVCLESHPQNLESWLKKNTLSTGGFGVSYLEKQHAFTQGIYFQRKLDGLNFSLTFIANGDEIQPIGFNALWCKELDNLTPYAYAGAINSVNLTEQQKDTAMHFAHTLTQAYNLIGINSIDFILSNDCVSVIELNPRISATFELYETKQGDLINDHISVCTTKRFTPRQRVTLLRAHAIVYAPRTVTVPMEFSWPLWTADRPHAKEVIFQNHPICSIFAGGKNEAQVKAMIRARETIIINKLMQTNSS